MPSQFGGLPLSDPAAATARVGLAFAAARPLFPPAEIECRQANILLFIAIGARVQRRQKSLLIRTAGVASGIEIGVLPPYRRGVPPEHGR
jgi:hypothetical protein